MPGLNSNPQCNPQSNPQSNSQINPKKVRDIIIAVLGCTVVVFFFVVVLLAIGSAKEKEKKDDVETEEEFVLRTYGHLFVQFDEQTTGSRIVRTNDGREMTYELCVRKSEILPTTGMERYAWIGRKKCEGQTFFHGCCNSTVEIMVPETAIDVEGQQVTLVQYYPTYVQRFSTETCMQVTSCQPLCTCVNVLSYATAVIRLAENSTQERKIGTTTIQYDGCCKCLNNIE